MIDNRILNYDAGLSRCQLNTIVECAQTEFASRKADWNKKDWDLFAKRISNTLSFELGGTWNVIVCKPNSYSASIVYESSNYAIVRLTGENDGIEKDLLILQTQVSTSKSRTFASW